MKMKTINFSGLLVVAITAAAMLTSCDKDDTPSKPTVAVQSITLDSIAATLTVGDTLRLTATVQPNDATNKTVTWSSDNTDVATVSNTGTVTAVAVGSATITATTQDGDKTAACTVTVGGAAAVPVTSVTLDSTAATLTVGEMLTLTATVQPENATNKTVTWSSDNTDVATVSSTGKVTAVTAGSATITATTQDGNKTATCAVTVEMKIATYTANGVSFDMVAVQGGDLYVGDSEIPLEEAKNVTLSSFRIGKTEVTQALWEAVMDLPTYRWSSEFGLGNNFPAYYVSWNDVQDFLTKLNALNVATGKTFRLPTEAEWEYAARGGKESQGYKYSGSNTIDDVAWYWDNIPSQDSENDGYGVQPVGTKQPNELGIYDMTGNVWEWCSDWYGVPFPSSATNPTGASSGTNRVRRGGHWNFTVGGCHVSYRNSSTPGDRRAYMGFRLVLVP